MKFSYRMPLLLAGAALVATPATASPTPPVRVDYQRFTLPNGLTAIVYTDHSVPSVHIGVRYRIGSKDEPAGRTGFAHLFEHLMFQSTKNRQGDFLPAMEAIGATDVNGQTTSDWTDYHETVPTNALDRALWMESDRMQYLADGITQGELDRQRGVVKNEKRQNESRAADRFLASYYPVGHPYAHPVIGSMEDLDHASLGDVRQWFSDYYGATNAVIVLAGDIDPDVARDKIARYFGAVRPGIPVDRIEQWLPTMSEMRRETIYDQVEAPVITRSWPVPNISAQQKTLLQLAARALAGSPASALDRAMVVEHHVATTINASLDESQLGSTFTLTVSLRPDVSVEQARKMLDDAMARFLAQGSNAAALRNVTAASDMALLNLLESAPSVGGWLIAGQVDHDDPAYFLKQRGWLDTATVADVRTVAARWLSQPYHEMTILPLPQPAAAAGANQVDRRQPPPIAAEPLARTVPYPPIYETRLRNGLRVVVAERHHVPIVEAQLRFAIEGAASTSRNAAFALLAEGGSKQGTTSFKDGLAALGAGFATSVDSFGANVTWNATTGHLAAATALIADAIRAPAYPATEVRRLRDDLAAQRASTNLDPVGLAQRVLLNALWGRDHPFGHIAQAADLAALDRPALMQFHERWLGPDNATLYLVGDITPDQARLLAERAFAGWVSTKPVSGAAVPAPGDHVPRVILIDSPGTAQSVIVAGHFVAPYDPAHAAAQKLSDTILGSGFDSRLNADLRSARGWTYGITAAIGDAPRGNRLFMVSGSVQADRTAQSMGQIRDDIAGYVRSAPATDAELATARVAAIRSIPLGYTGNTAFRDAIASADLHRLPLDYGKDAALRLERVTIGEIRDFAAHTYRPDAMTWVIVGDLASIERDVRAMKLGPVEIWNKEGRRVR